MPFFGVPIRNGLPIGLGSVAGFGVQQFDPSQLFQGGTVAGAWYDPSDLSTMFTTDAGTTPVAMPGGGSAVSVGRILDKSGNGNHAIAFNNTTARPELRARVNLLTYSEEFDNGAWTTKLAITITPNSTASPNGTVTADTLTEDTSNNSHIISRTLTLTPTQYIFSLYVKLASGTRQIDLIPINGGVIGSNGGVTFDSNLQYVATFGTGVTAYSTTPVGNGWHRLTVTATVTATGTATPVIRLRDAGTVTYTGDGTSGFYIWGADLRPANIGANVPAYQRIADANTYDTSGFPLYLRFDGIDDSMYTPANLNLSSTDKVAVFAGVRKLSDAALGIFAELSAVANSNNGAFAVAAPGWSPVTSQYGSLLRATVAFEFANSPASFSAPITNVLTNQFFTTGSTRADRTSLRVNGAAQTLTFTDNTTASGNFGTYPLYIGSRNNASFFLNGHLYSLIIAGSAVSAGNISATEQWVAGKTGLVLAPPPPPPPPPSGWDLSTAAYSGASFSVAAQEATPTGVAFKSDGTKMFIIGSNGDDINEYALSTPWDISTASFTANTSVAAQTTAPNDLFFKFDGLKVYVVAATRVYEYNLSSAWDITTLTYSGNLFSVSSQDSSAKGVSFKPDGTTMFVVGDAGDAVFSYNLSSAWDITTASYSGNSFNVAAQDLNPQSLFFKPDGTKMFALGSANDSVYEYSLSFAWDITTAGYITSFSVVSQETSPNGLSFKPDGTMMFVVGQTADTVFAYTL